LERDRNITSAHVLQTEADHQSMFTETTIGRRKRWTQNAAKLSLMFATLLMIVPLLLIVGHLFYKAAPILSLDFLLTNPVRGMRAGGIWPAFLGTMYLVTTLTAGFLPPSAFWRQCT